MGHPLDGPFYLAKIWSEIWMLC